MPEYSELKQPKIHLKETEKETEIDNDAPVFQLGSQGGAGSSPPDEGGLPAGSDNDRLFSFIRETHLQEAQEFRRKGHNSQVPKVDSRLVTQLHEALRKARTQISHHATVRGPLGSMWLQGQIGEIERLTDKLSDDVIKSWVEHEVPGKRSGEADGEEVELGSRRMAQSLVRRLESTLRTLIRLVDTLRAIDDHSTPETRADLLVTELASVFSSYDKGSVTQALERMKSEDTAWSSLMQARAAAWETTDKAAAIRTMSKTTQHEAEKAKKKADKLPRNSDSRAFFLSVGAYLELLSVELIKASGSASQVTFPPVMPHDNDKTDTLLSRLDHLPQRFIAGVRNNKLKTQIALAVGEEKLYRLAQTIRPSNNTDEAKSVIRSILWQWQQPAIKIQYASGTILSKVKELKEIKEMFSSDAVTYDNGSQQEGQDTPVSYPGEDDLDAHVRQWVNDSIEQAKPENQQAEQLAVLNKLLDGDIENARALVGRLREKAENMQDLLRKQRFAVLKMIMQRSGRDLSLRAVDKLLPKVAKGLTVSLAALENACQAAAIRDFAKAQEQADYAQLRATKVKVDLSEQSTQLTGRPLDDLSRGSRLAKHWASLAREQRQSNEPPPDAERVFSSLKQQGLLEGVLSSGDPEGYIFATRLAGELENACNDELRLPMSPEQYTALEKGLVEYIVKWGQKRVSRGIARIIIELSFEQGLDAVSFSVSSLFRIPFKVLKASIKIPYNVNKVNNYIMPGQDKPYKAIYGMLEKKLKQLGFNMLTAPVPGMIKLVAGAGITAGAALYNLHVGNRENTFSAVYQRLTEGGKSGKIKMNSVGEMVFDSVIDTTTSAAFKGARIAWKAGESESNVIPDKAFVNEHVGAVLAQRDQMEAEEDSPVWGNAAENEREAEPVSDSMPLRQQTDVEPFSDENDQASGQLHVRRKRAVPPAPSSNVREGVPAPSRQWHHNIPAGASLQSEHFDFDRGIRYQDFSDEKKQHTYTHGIAFVLHQIENDDSLPKAIRDQAYLARHGAKNLTLVDIKNRRYHSTKVYTLNNTIFLPDSHGSKTGVLICLDSETPYYHVRQGSDLPEGLVSAMPYQSDMPQRHQVARPPVSIKLPSGVEMLRDIRAGGPQFFNDYFNYNNLGPMDVASLSTRLANTIKNDYQLAGRTIENRLLISRAIAGAHIPDDGVRVREALYHVDYSWGGSTAAEYLRAFERPFSTLSGDMQSIISSAKGETVQEANMHIHQAEYIGSWIDVTAGAITSLTPEGMVLNTLQSAAGIIADLTEGKTPDPLTIAAAVIGCIPEGKIVAKIAKLSRIGGTAVKYGLMLGNKSVDLAIVGRSIKIAVETGDPLTIYQALLMSGMSTRSSYDMAKNMSSRLNISRRMEDSASWEDLEAIHNNTPESILPSTMTERRFRVGSTELRGRINNGEIEISSDGVTWDKGSTLHLLAYRLQNAGGKNRLPVGGYEPHTPNYQHDYSMDLSGFSEWHAKLKLSKSGTRVQRFNEETNSYYNVHDYEVVPYKTTISDVDTVLEDRVVRLALADMHRRYEALKDIAADYTGSGAADLKQNLQTGGALVFELGRGLPDNPSASLLHFLLIEKTAGPVTIDKILGIGKIVDLLPGNQPGEKGSIILESVVAHPYTLISKNEEFMRYAASKGLRLSQEDRTRYNIKQVGGQLMRDGLKETIKKINQEVKDNERSSRPENIQFSSRNPITARMAERFGARRIGASDTAEVNSVDRTPEKLIAARRGYKDYSLSTTSAVREYTILPEELQRITHKANRNVFAFNRIYGDGTAEVLPASVAAGGENVLSLRLKKLPGKSLAEIIEGADQATINAVLSSYHNDAISDLVTSLIEGGVVHNDIDLHNIVYDPIQRRFYFSDFDDVVFMGSNASGERFPLDRSDITRIQADLVRTFNNFAVSTLSTSVWGPKLPAPHSSISTERAAELKALADGTRSDEESRANQKVMTRNEGTYYTQMLSYTQNMEVWNTSLYKGTEKYTSFYERPGVQVDKSNGYKERYMEEPSQDKDALYIDEKGGTASSPGKEVVLNVKGDTRKQAPYRFRVSDDGKILVIDNMYGNIDRGVNGAGEALPMNELQGEFLKSRPDFLKNIEYVTQESVVNPKTQTILRAISSTIQKGLNKELIVLTPDGGTAAAFRVMLDTPNVQPTARMLSTYPEIGKQIVEIRIYGFDRITMVLGDRRTVDIPVEPNPVLEQPDLGNPLTPLTREQLTQLADAREIYRAHLETAEDSTRVSREIDIGKRNPKSLESLVGVNRDMSELELTVFYNDRAISWEQRGALSVLIEEARTKRIISASFSTVAKYSKILTQGSTSKVLAPQAFLLAAGGGDVKGQCAELSLIMAAALDNGKVESLILNLYRAAAHTEGPNRQMFRSLAALHGTSVSAHLTPISFAAGRNTGTIGEIVNQMNGATESRLFRMEAGNHAMMVGVTIERVGRAKTFHYYDPNVGLFSYSTARELQTAMQRTVGTTAVGEQYQAFGSRSTPQYRLNEINIETLAAFQIHVPAREAVPAREVRVRDLYEEEVEALSSCTRAVKRSQRSPGCSQLQADIVRFENIQEAIFTNVRPEAGSSEFALSYVEPLRAQNAEHAMGLYSDMQILDKARAEVVGFRDQLAAEVSQGGSREKIRNLQAQASATYLNYLSSLIEVTRKVELKTELIESATKNIQNVLNKDIVRVPGAGVRPGDTVRDTGTIMRYMSRAEADAMIASKKFSQGALSFEQHKWFFTDKQAYDPKGGAGFECVLTIRVPKGTIPKIFDIASADPKGTTQPVRYKPGGEHSVEQAELGAFGIHRFGLEAFSDILANPQNWGILDLRAGKKIPNT